MALGVALGMAQSHCHQPARDLCFLQQPLVKPSRALGQGFNSIPEGFNSIPEGFNSTPNEHKGRVGSAAQLQPSHWASKVKPGLKLQPWSLQGRDPSTRFTSRVQGFPGFQAREWGQQGICWGDPEPGKALEGQGGPGLIPVASGTLTYPFLQPLHEEIGASRLLAQVGVFGLELCLLCPLGGDGFVLLLSVLKHKGL